ncbi:transcription/translation regulatory transformer protein RfaH [Pseudomonas tussilaginis]|uniref:transcription/translation regulatory transformer protein RfaH n=1 Tax=Pseudomonas sp. 5 TaxID=1619949 RepID=UPI0005EB4451|nr:transcription/translation regulatory transformer protein RfaH [Pseudomonas sp. 5]KJK09794.1 antitermination protein NusG [Pseudomonas sp. 5]
MKQQSWYLVQCKPRQDERAEQNLVRQGYLCFRPKLKRERVIRGGTKVALESLFPGYLFIHMSEGANWAPLNSTRGVSRVVSFGAHPLAVGEEMVQQLQQRAESELCTQLKIGDNVRITSGSFEGLDAIFTASDGSHRAWLLITLLNRQQEISLPFANVMAI